MVPKEDVNNHISSPGGWCLAPLSSLGLAKADIGRLGKLLLQQFVSPRSLGSSSPHASWLSIGSFLFGFLIGSLRNFLVHGIWIESSWP